MADLVEKSSADNIIGGLGDDELYGSDRDNFMIGISGNDKIYGFGGNDLISAGPGDDIVYAGEGADRLKLDPSDETITWEDFEDVIDRIDVSASLEKDQFANAVTISATEDGTSAIVTYEGVEVSLTGITPDKIDQDDFIFNDTVDAIV